MLFTPEAAVLAADTVDQLHPACAVFSGVMAQQPFSGSGKAQKIPFAFRQLVFRHPGEMVAVSDESTHLFGLSA